ncbi:hypothetical protein IWX91DRAFT_334621, partial [Phyllosticta citricarpa]
MSGGLMLERSLAWPLVATLECSLNEAWPMNVGMTKCQIEKQEVKGMIDELNRRHEAGELVGMRVENGDEDEEGD